MKKWILWTIIGVIVASGGMGLTTRFFFFQKEEPGSQGSLVTVQRGDITRIVSATGSLSCQASGEVKFSKHGRIKEIVGQEGDYVKEGQILAKLEDEKERLSLVRGENALKEAESELESAKLSSPQSVIENKGKAIARAKT